MFGPTVQPTPPPQQDATAQQSSARSQAPAASADQSDIVQQADSFSGTPYVFGAKTGDTRSFDCSSFVQYLYQQHGVNLPRVAYDQFEATQGGSVSLDQAQPGDLVFFKDTYDANNPLNISHVAVYKGDGKFVGAQGNNVNTDSLDNPYWKDKLVAIHRIGPPPAATSDAGPLTTMGGVQQEQQAAIPTANQARDDYAQQPAADTTTTTPGGANLGGGGYGMTEQEAFIRDRAARYGIDPNTAVAVANSEGGVQEWAREGDKTQGGSYGPFQLFMGGGLGNAFVKETGLDPSDPKNGPAATDWALRQIAQGGWGPWHGAARIGVTGMQGIAGNPSNLPPPDAGSGGGGSSGRSPGLASPLPPEAVTEPGGYSRLEQPAAPAPLQPAWTDPTGGFLSGASDVVQRLGRLATQGDLTDQQSADLSAQRQEQQARMGFGPPTTPGGIPTGQPAASLESVGGPFASAALGFAAPGVGITQAARSLIGNQDPFAAAAAPTAPTAPATPPEYMPGGLQIAAAQRIASGASSIPSEVLRSLSDVGGAAQTMQSQPREAIQAAVTSGYYPGGAIQALNDANGYAHVFKSMGADDDTAQWLGATALNVLDPTMYFGAGGITRGLEAVGGARAVAAAMLLNGTIGGVMGALQAPNPDDRAKYAATGAATMGFAGLATMGAHAPEEAATLLDQVAQARRAVARNPIEPDPGLVSLIHSRLADALPNATAGAVRREAEGAAQVATALPDYARNTFVRAFTAPTEALSTAEQATRSAVGGPGESLFRRGVREVANPYAVTSGVPVTVAPRIGPTMTRGLDAIGRATDAAATGLEGAWRRFYHGTGVDFSKVSGKKMLEESLYGPEYYGTTSPEVASQFAQGRAERNLPVPSVRAFQSAAAAIGQETGLGSAWLPRRDLANILGDWRGWSYGEAIDHIHGDLADALQNRGVPSAVAHDVVGRHMPPIEPVGANVRAFDVPESAVLLQADARPTADDLARFRVGMQRAGIAVPEDQVETAMIGSDLYNLALGAAGGDTRRVGRALSEGGFDGIEYEGTTAHPMRGPDGKIIEHQAVAMFPESLPKLRNALSGLAGGSEDAAPEAAGALRPQPWEMTPQDVTTALDRGEPNPPWRRYLYTVAPEATPAGDLPAGTWFNPDAPVARAGRILAVDPSALPTDALDAASNGYVRARSSIPAQAVIDLGPTTAHEPLDLHARWAATRGAPSATERAIQDVVGTPEQLVSEAALTTPSPEGTIGGDGLPTGQTSIGLADSLPAPEAVSLAHDIVSGAADQADKEPPWWRQQYPEFAKVNTVKAEMDRLGLLSPEGITPGSPQAQRLSGLFAQGNRPSYLRDVEDMILWLRNRTRNRGVTARDVIKAYLPTLASQRAQDMALPTFQEKILNRMPWFRLDTPVKGMPDKTLGDLIVGHDEQGRPIVRPEDAMAAALLTPTGQAFLDSWADRGVWREDLWQRLRAVRAAWGNMNTFDMATNPPAGKYGLHTIGDFVRAANSAGDDTNAIHDLTLKLGGISFGKYGYVAKGFGYGERPTLDAREILVNIMGTADAAAGRRADPRIAALASAAQHHMRSSGFAAYLSDRLARTLQRYSDVTGVGLDIAPEARGAVMHHHLWDASLGQDANGMPIIQTTHAIEAPLYKFGARGGGAALGAGVGAATTTDDQGNPVPILSVDANGNPVIDPRVAGRAAVGALAGGAGGYALERLAPAASHMAWGEVGKAADRSVGELAGMASGGVTSDPVRGPMEERYLSLASKGLTVGGGAGDAPAGTQAATLAKQIVRGDGAPDVAQAAGARGRKAAVDTVENLDRALSRIWSLDRPNAEALLRNVADQYERLSPARAEATTDAVRDTWLKTHGQQYAPLFDAFLPYADAMNARNRVTMTFVGPQALVALADHGVFTNLASVAKDYPSLADMHRASVGPGRYTRAIEKLRKGLTPDQARARGLDLSEAEIERLGGRDFVQRLEAADRTAYGATNVPLDEAYTTDPLGPQRLYAYQTLGQPEIGDYHGDLGDPQKLNVGLAWKDRARGEPGPFYVSSLLHHFAGNSADYPIHGSMGKMFQDVLWAPGAVEGERGATLFGPLTTTTRATGIDVGQGRFIGKTNLLVGPSAADRAQSLNLLLGMGEDTPAAVAMREGRVTTPEDLYAALAAGGTGQNNPLYRRYNMALGLKENAAIPEAAKSNLGLSYTPNRARQEALILDPHPDGVKFFYARGTLDELLHTQVAGDGRSTFDVLRAAQERAGGPDAAPIVLYDQTVPLDAAGAPNFPEGREINARARVVNPDGTLGSTVGEALPSVAPDRPLLRRSYTGLGLVDKEGKPVRNMGQVNVQHAMLAGAYEGAAVGGGGLYGYATAPDNATPEERQQRAEEYAAKFGIGAAALAGVGAGGALAWRHSGSLGKAIKDSTATQRVFYAANLMSNIASQARNVMGNVTSIAMQPAESTASAASFGLARRLSGQVAAPRTRFGPPELKAATAGSLRGAVDGFNTAMEIMAHGETANPTEWGAAMSDVAHGTGPAVPAQAAGTIRPLPGTGVKPARAASPVAARAGAERTVVQGLPMGISADRGLAGNIASALATPITAPLNYGVLRPMTAMDELFKGVVYHQALLTEFYRMARANGMRGTAADDFVRLQQQGMQTAVQRGVPLAGETQAAVERAAKFARYQTYQQEMDRVGKALTNIQKLPVLGPLIMPFARTPYNILKYGLERSPLAAGSILLDVKRGVYNPASELGKAHPEQIREVGDLADRLGRLWMGLGFVAGAAALYKAGILTGAAPTDPGLAQEWRDSGKHEFSINVDGYSLPLLQLPSLGPTMAATVGVMDAMDKRAAHAADHPEDPPPSIATQAADVFDGVTSSLQNQGFAQSWMTLSSVIDALGGRQGPPSDMVGNPLQKEGSRIIAGMVPGSALLRAVTSATDTYDRRQQGLLAGSQAVLPPALGALGLPNASQLPPRTVLGRPVPRVQRTIPGAVLSPFTPNEDRTDPVERAFMAAGEKVPGAGTTLEGQNLTPEQRDAYDLMLGQRIRPAVGALAARPGFSAATTARQKQLIDTTTEQRRALARLQFLASGETGMPTLRNEALHEPPKYSPAEVLGSVRMPPEERHLYFRNPDALQAAIELARAEVSQWQAGGYVGPSPTEKTQALAALAGQTTRAWDTWNERHSEVRKQIGTTVGALPRGDQPLTASP